MDMFFMFSYQKTVFLSTSLQLCRYKEYMENSQNTICKNKEFSVPDKDNLEINY